LQYSHISPFQAKLRGKKQMDLLLMHALTTAYHPQSNDQTERANQEVEQHLRLFANVRQDNWVEHLPTVEFVLNSHVHSTHHMAPFKVMYGYCPDFTIPFSLPTEFPALNSCLLILQETCKEVEAALRMEKRTMKQAFKLNKPPPQTFTLGKKVWLSSKDINVSDPGRKLTPRQLGSYEVIDHTGELTYRLHLPPSMHQHPVFYIDRLPPWHGNETNGLNAPPPPSVQINDEIEYEVEAILDSHKY
jgi:hypothetical protein